MDVGIFTFISVLGGLLILSSGGITSPYCTGLIVILVSRGATTLAPWRRGVWMFGIPALAFPSLLGFAALVDEQIAAQFNDPIEFSKIVMFWTFMAMTWLLLTLGGDFAWRLRREVLETRNIGRYKLERRIGCGGMGDVWAAYDLALKHRVALKTVSGRRQGSSALLRFEREARALAELTHPNTVRVFDYGVTDDGLWYYAMELLEGENLHDLVMRSGPLSVQRLVHIGRQVLRALGVAHAKGIIHRDIKPENVFARRARRRAGYRQVAGLRYRQGPARHRCEAHPDRNRHRNAGVHAARGPARPDRRRPLGHLLCWRDPLLCRER
jgi:serine/threonine-protein kinase